jgi:glycosyl transferase family 2
MSAAPRVSVCVPARDAAAFLPRALASALAQDVDGLEVIVGDDGSADATAEIAAADPRVRLVRQRRPVGVAANRNALLAAARGTYVAWLDADDEYLAGALARQLAVLDSDPRIAVVHGGCAWVDVAGAHVPGGTAPFARDAVEAPSAAFRQLLAANELTTSTVVARRHGERFDPAIGRSSTDWHLWLRLARRGAVAYTAAPAARYRRHAGTISHATAASGERLRCDVRVVARVLRGPERPAGAARIGTAALAAKALLHAGDAHTRGDRPAALAAISLALRLGADAGGLPAATRRGDDAACSRVTKRALAQLGERLAGTRFGARVARLAEPDAAWDAALAHAGRFAARSTPRGAVLAAVAKWDPALLVAAGREGCNYPDRALLGDGYPSDGAAAVAHLDDLRRTRGITHLVVPSVSAWWLDAYPALAARLGRPHAADGRCAVYAL